MSKWLNLNHIQLNREGRKFAEMAFSEAGFDVYISSHHKKAIDFIVKNAEDRYYDIQVSSMRENSSRGNYVFYKKKLFRPRKNLLVVLAIFVNNGNPSLYLIPSLDWSKSKYGNLLVEHEKSEPEWGIYLRESNIDLLKKSFSFDRQVADL